MPDSAPSPSRSAAFYASIGLVSAIVLALQILQSRIFSVTTYYHLSFLVISISMFGLTLGAMRVYKSDEAQLRDDWPCIAGNSSKSLALAILASLVVQIYVPLVHENILKTLLFLPLVALFSGIPAYLAGVLISLSLTRTPYPVAKTYGADLIGAALGCFAVLLIMQSTDAPSGIVLLSCLALVAGKLYVAAAPQQEKKHKDLQQQLSLWLIPFVLLTLYNGLSHDKPLSIRWVKANFQPESAYDLVVWNPISRVTISPDELVQPFLWGPASKNRKVTQIHQRWLTIDGGAATPLTKFDGTSFEQLAYLEDDVTNIGHLFSKGKDIAVVGVGGGRDVLSAYYYGAKSVTAIDINPAQIEFLTEHPYFKDYTNLHQQPGIQIFNDEARSWFARNHDRKFDLIQMSLIDTFAASAAGAFALSENTLYTRDAWTSLMKDLNDDGIFTVSRWYTKEIDLESARLVSLAMSSLWEQGVTSPRDHIVMVASERVASILVSKTPFSQEQLDRIEEQADLKGFSVLLSPRGGEDAGMMRRLYDCDSPEMLRTYIETLKFDLAAPTDWRPFFFNQTKFNHPIALIKDILAIPGSEGLYVGHIHATMNLIFINLFSLIVVFLILIYPQLSSVAGVKKSDLVLSSLYFLLIGLGFMFFEIALIQILGIFLGHPIYSLSVTLFSLILFTGFGSLLSQRFPLRRRSAALAWAASVFVYGACLPMLVDLCLENFMESTLLLRCAISVVGLLPLGLLLGYGFPTGMTLGGHISSRMTPWLWGVNGAAGVLGSSMAVTFNIAFGVQTSVLLGALCYGLLAVPLWALTQTGKNKLEAPAQN